MVSAVSSIPAADAHAAKSMSSSSAPPLQPKHAMNDKIELKPQALAQSLKKEVGSLPGKCARQLLDAKTAAPKDVPKDAPKGTTSGDAKVAPKDTPTGAPRDRLKDVPKDLPPPPPSGTPKNAPENLHTATPTEGRKDVPKDTPACTLPDNPRNAPKDTPKGEPSGNPKPVPKDASKCTPSGRPKGAAKDVREGMAPCGAKHASKVTTKSAPYCHPKNARMDASGDCPAGIPAHASKDSAPATCPKPVSPGNNAPKQDETCEPFMRALNGLHERAMCRAKEAKTPAEKAHAEAEAKQIRQTIDSVARSAGGKAAANPDERKRPDDGPTGERASSLHGHDGDPYEEGLDTYAPCPSAPGSPLHDQRVQGNAIPGGGAAGMPACSYWVVWHPTSWQPNARQPHGRSAVEQSGTGRTGARRNCPRRNCTWWVCSGDTCSWRT